MGQGKRILKWLKKRLLGRKVKRLFGRKGCRMASAVPMAAPNQQEIETDRDNISDTFSDVSLANYLSPECSEPPLPAERKMLFCHDSDARENELPTLNPPCSNMGLGRGRYRPKHVLPPIIEVHEESITPSRAMPELDVATSRQGNVAFEVSFAEEAHPQTASIPERFSSMGNHNERSSANWEGRMKNMERNRQAHLRLRCESLKERRLIAENMRLRKIADAVKFPSRKLALLLNEMKIATENRNVRLSEVREKSLERHRRGEEVRMRKKVLRARSLARVLGELPSIPDVEARSPSQGGVGFSNRSLPESKASGKKLQIMSSNIKAPVDRDRPELFQPFLASKEFQRKNNYWMLTKRVLSRPLICGGPRIKSGLMRKGEVDKTGPAWKNKEGSQSDTTMSGGLARSSMVAAKAVEKTHHAVKDKDMGERGDYSGDHSEFDFGNSDGTPDERSSLHRDDNTRSWECPGSTKGGNGGVGNSGDDSSDTSSLAGKPKLRQKNKSISFSDEVDDQKQQSCGKKDIGPSSPFSTSSLKSCLAHHPPLITGDMGTEHGLPGKLAGRSLAPEQQLQDKQISTGLFLVKKDSMQQQKVPERLAGRDVVPELEIPAKLTSTDVFPVKDVMQQAMKKWQEENEVEKTQRSEEEMETERRWLEVHAENEKLWKLEQLRNERKWRARLMENEMRWQEQQARWEEERKEWQEVELKWEAKLQEELVEKEKEKLLTVESVGNPNSTILRLPACTSSGGTEPGGIGSNSNSTMGNSHSNSISHRHQKPHSIQDVPQLSKVAQSTCQVSKTEISANAGGYLRMPSIDTSRSGRLLVSLDQYSQNLTDDRQFWQAVLPAGQKKNKLMKRRATGFKRPGGLGKTKKEGKDLFLPPLINFPLSCQPLDLSNPPCRTARTPESPRGRPKFTLPQKSDGY